MVALSLTLNFAAVIKFDVTIVYLLVGDFAVKMYFSLF